MPRKPSRKTLTRKLDTAWSLKTRSKGRCELCGGTQALQTHHFYSRSIKRLRWDERNLVCVDARCHWLAHKQPAVFVEWFKKKRPEDYEYLRKAVNEISHYTAEDYQEMLEAVEAA